MDMRLVGDGDGLFGGDGDEAFTGELAETFDDALVEVLAPRDVDGAPPREDTEARLVCEGDGEEELVTTGETCSTDSNNTEPSRVPTYTNVSAEKSSIV